MLKFSIISIWACGPLTVHYGIYQWVSFCEKILFFVFFSGKRNLQLLPNQLLSRFASGELRHSTQILCSLVKRNVFFFLFISHNRRREKQMLRKGEAPRDLLIQFPPFSCYCWRFFLSFGFSIINSVEDERARELRVRHDDAPLPIHSPSPRIIFHIIFTSFYTSPRS